MKNLYNIVESILDDQDIVMDKATDDTINSIIKNAFHDAKFKYDPKKKVIKLPDILQLTWRDNEVCIFGMTKGKFTNVPLRTITDLGISFDASLMVSSEAMSNGFKLSQAHIVGKNHRMVVSDRGGNGIPGTGINPNDIQSFIDCPTTAFDVIAIGRYPQLVSDPVFKKFPVVWVEATYGFNHSVKLDVENCKASTLVLINCAQYINPNTKYKSFEEAFQKESEYSYTSGYSVHNMWGSGSGEVTCKQFCIDLIKANPGCNIIVQLGYGKPTHIWMDGDELKWKQLSGNRPWTKI